jgi:cytochrome c oxidase subunit 3
MSSSSSTDPTVQADHSGHSAHGEHGSHPNFTLTGFVIFLLSESVIFLAFFSGYAVLKLNATDWLPSGVEGLEWQTPLVNSVVLISSSGTIYLAEWFKHRGSLLGFRALWLLTMAMGAYFLWGQAQEWQSLSFGFTDGTFGGTFYLLTGFHGLHVATGVLLMALMLVKSFLPGNYEGGEQGVVATSLFWHFVDVIWIALFLLLYVWR